MNKRLSKIICGAAVVLALGVPCLFMQTVFAEGKAIVDIGPGGSSGTGGGGGGGGGCSGDGAKYLLECTGMSWVFYESQVSSEDAASLTFVPQKGGAQNLTISAECASHRDDVPGKPGGFWHFGWNANAFSYHGYASYTDILNNGTHTSVNWSSAYYATGWGHMATFNRNDIEQVYTWAQYKMQTPLGQDLYARVNNATGNGASEYKKIYTATKTTPDPESGNATVEFMEDWNLACTSAGLSDCSVETLRNVRYFCWWPTMGNDPKFEGVATAAGTGFSITTDWKSDNNIVPTDRKPYEFECGNTEEGCGVNFTLGVRRSTGDSGQTNFFIKKGNSPDNMNQDTDDGTCTQSNPCRSNADGSAVTMVYPENLKPGETMCYHIEFYVDGDEKQTKAYEKACVKAVEKKVKTVTLTAKAVNTSGNPIPNAASQYTWTDTGPAGTPHTVTVDDIPGYTFVGFKMNVAAIGYLTKGNKTYTETIGVDTWRYAVYKPNDGPEDNDPLPDCRPASESEIVKMSVANNSTNTGWQDEVYAKPEDNLTYCASYNPEQPQSYYDDGVNKNSSCLPSGSDHSEKAFGPLEGQVQFNGWNNAFSFHFDKGFHANASFGSGDLRGMTKTTVANKGTFSSVSNNNGLFKYTNGDTTTQYEKNQYKDVPVTDTAKTLDERAILNYYSNAQTTPTYSWINPHTCRIGHTVSCGGCTGYLEFERENGHYEYYDCSYTNSKGETVSKTCKYWVCDSHTCGEYFSQSNITHNQNVSYARARVPYNFKNNSVIKTPGYKTDDDYNDDTHGRGTIVYAGEEQTIHFDVVTEKRQNSETKGYYATQVHNAFKRLKICYTDSITNSEVCKYTDIVGVNDNSTSSAGSTLDPGDDLSNSSSQDEKVTAENVQVSLTIPDVPAGSKIRVYSMVFPKDSGYDKNWTDPYSGYGNPKNHPNDETGWAISEPVEYVVAKRPSVQAWGGNVYSGSGSTISTVLAGKYHVAGLTEYKARNDNYSTRKYLFGSWAELGMISNGTINISNGQYGMASGAALGYTEGSGLVTSYTSTFCNRIPLTFANASSAGACISPGSLNKASESKSDLDKSSIKDKFIYDDGETYNGSNLSFGTEDKYLKDNNVYFYKTNQVSVSGFVPKATTQVVYATNSITVSGDITYGDATFTNFDSLPKVVLYADSEIKIACSVSRIDAVVVAPKVTTCYDGERNDGNYTANPYEYKDYLGVTQKIYSLIKDITGINQQSQLKVNGAVITKTLVANRSYGAGPGVKEYAHNERQGLSTDSSYHEVSSVTAAEVFNFDPSLYRWEVNTGNSASADDVTASTDLTTTYVKELAPRY